MGYPAYITNNLLYNLDYDTDVTSGTEDASYPLENLSDKNPANVFKFTSAASGYIEFDLGGSLDIDTCALINHTFDSGDTVVIKADDFSPPTTEIMTLTYQINDMFNYLSAPVTARYVRLEWTGATATPAIGELVLGELALLTGKFRMNVLAIDIEEKIGRETPRGVHSSFDMFSIKKKTYEFTNLTISQKAEFKAIHNTTEGDRYPFLWIPDIAKNTLLYGYKQADFRISNAGINKFNFDLIMTSASRGE